MPTRIIIMKRMLVSLYLVFLLGTSAFSKERAIDFTVTAREDSLHNAIAIVRLHAKLVGDAASVSVVGDDGKEVPAQLAKPHLLARESGSKGEVDADDRELHVLIADLKPGQSAKFKLTVSGDSKPTDGFAWKMIDGHEELLLNGRPLVRYMNAPYDSKLTQAKKEIANPTTKPYHHLFAPDGKTLVTNGPEGIYPHHRGILYGFNNITYDGKKADVWHCRNGEHTIHEKVLASEQGKLFGRHTLQIGWIGQDGKPFASEKRELTFYNLPGGTLIDFESVLTTPLDKVRLDGDPQHAGFHFRANSAMEKNIKETFFIRPDGKGKPGEEKNWDPKSKKGPVNLPWDAMSFVLDGNRYTVVYLDHPDNPKEARQSERCYGRIGTYFGYDLAKDHPLKVRYRLWFQAGEPTVDQCNLLDKAFVNPPTTKMASR